MSIGHHSGNPFGITVLNADSSAGLLQAISSGFTEVKTLLITGGRFQHFCSRLLEHLVEITAEKDMKKLERLIQ